MKKKHYHMPRQCATLLLTFCLTILFSNFLHAQVNLGIVKTGPASVAPNGAISYKLMVTNSGPNAADGAIVTDPAVANVTATTVTCAAGSGVGGSAGCPASPTIAGLQGSGLVIPALPSGGSVTLTVTGTAAASGTITNVATVTAPTGTTDSDPANNTSTLVTTIDPTCSNQTVYTFDPIATNTAAAATAGANGGTVNLVYNLTSGPAIAGMGTTFTVPMTYTDFNQALTGSNHTWDRYEAPFGSFAWDGTNSTQAFSLVPNEQSFYTALPANNTTQKPALGNTDNFFTNRLANNTLTQLGTFDITIGAVPTPPAGVKLVSESIRIFSSNNASTNGNGNYQAGWWLKSIAQNAINTTTGGQTVPLPVSHGNTYSFKYSAFTDNSNFADDAGGRGVLFDLGQIVFCTQATVTLSGTVHSDPDGGDISGTGTNAGGTLYATLLDAANAVVASEAVAANGTYSFPGIVVGDYNIVLGAALNNTTPGLPAGYTNTNEGLTPIGDGTANGIIPVTVAGTDITTADFAIAAPIQPTFACTDNIGFLFQDNPTDAYTVNLVTGEATLVKSDILGTTNAQLNAFGYNLTDNYIWGFRRGTNEVVRIGSDWTAQTFPIAGLPASGEFFIGDVSSAGVLFLYNNAIANTTIYRVDVNPSSPTYLTALPTLTTTATEIADWAFSPIDGNLYSIGIGGNYNLVRFNPATGARTNLGTVTGGGVQGDPTFGAVYMDNEGSFYLSNNNTGNIFKIATPHTGNTTATLFSTGPTSFDNDGARCPMGIVAAGVTLSGTVHNDADGGDISGTGTNAGGTLYATLLDAANAVVASEPVAANGTYSFPNVAPGSYTVVLGTALNDVTAGVPTGYVNTNEGLTPTGDGTTDGIIPVTVAAADITDMDFAIEQLPVATPATVAGQPNPGGTTTADITANFVGTDPDGNVVSLFFPTFPNDVTTLSINGTPYNSGNFPAGGVTVPVGSPVLIDPVDGAVTPVIPFSVIDNAGEQDPTPADVTVPFTVTPGVTLSGTVHNDADGGDISGPGINAGGTLYATLLDAANAVVASEPVAANGTYSFPNVAPGSYTVVLGTALNDVTAGVPTGYVNTNEGLTPTGDGTTDGIIPVTVAAADITDMDFAIEQLPVATPATVAGQPNPGGTTTADITANFVGTDPDGNVVSLFFPTFPNDVTTLSINGTPYNSGNFPAGGVTVPVGSPVLIDPVDGAVTPVVPFSVIDNAGEQDPTPADVTVPFTVTPGVTLSGTVHNDADGGNINGPGINAGGTLYATLLDAANAVVASEPVAANGTYSFPNVAPGSYTVVLGTALNDVTAGVPTGYVNTNEGLTPTGDGTTNGIIPVTVAAADITDVDFAIEQLPVATPVTIPTQTNPGGVVMVDLTPHFVGTDDPDGTVVMLSFRSFPADVTTIVIDNTPYTSTTFPAGGVTVPIGSQVSIDPTDMVTTVVIPFSLIDNAGQEGPTANVTVPFTPLPVTLTSFTATKEGQTVLLNWSTTQETNSDRFEVQHSMNGKDWKMIGTVHSANESTSLQKYTFVDREPANGENLYRLKMIDRDATFAYSRLQNVDFDIQVRTTLYPNPVVDKLTLDVDDFSTVQRVQINNLKGEAVYDQMKQKEINLSKELDVTGLPTGAYVVRVTRTNGDVVSIKVIKQ